jgi:hypothetical protein
LMPAIIVPQNVCSARTPTKAVEGTGIQYGWIVQRCVWQLPKCYLQKASFQQRHARYVQKFAKNALKNVRKALTYQTVKVARRPV